MDGATGLDLVTLRRWVDSEHPSGVRPAGALSAEVIEGGRSNLTYRVTDGTHIWVLRRPPLGHVLPTAHDMTREFRVISALSGTSVPVPPPLALCADPGVIGAPFYLMDFVPGVVLDADRLDRLSAEQAGAVGRELVDTLVALHAVDPTAVGLGDFGRPAGYLHRQVERWHKQSLASQQSPRELETAVYEALGERLPVSGPGAIVHGDYRLSNVLFEADGAGIAAVVDWEMATLGDPLTDAGLLYVYHHLGDAGSGIMPATPADRGFLSAADLLRRYADASGRGLDELWWYVGFGFYKLGIICEGIAARYAQGLTVGAGFDQFAGLVQMLLERAGETLRTEQI